jgi:hypothetical protein
MVQEKGNRSGMTVFNLIKMRWIAGILVLALLGAGCTPTSDRQALLNGGLPVPKTISPWTFDGRPARLVTTQHYALHTTLDDEDLIDRLAQVMEGAFKQYQQLAPVAQVSDNPMDCYIFSLRTQWAKFTEQHTGADAEIYLQINRGGYTIRDWYVAYFIGDVGTYSVAAHEGWHQYVARNFKSRLPPFLEEGIATMFENINWPNQSPRWNLGANLTRADRLKSAIQDHQLWPLDQLCMMHAGDVVSLSGERIETFYAQNWAFAQFLMFAEGGKYRPAMQKMLADLASGDADALIGRHRGPPGTWDPNSVKPLLEHYLQMDIKHIDMAYNAYMRQLAAGVRPQFRGI